MLRVARIKGSVCDLNIQLADKHGPGSIDSFAKIYMYPSLNVLLIGSSESDFEHWTILHDRICGTGPTGRGRYYRRSRDSCVRHQYDRSFARPRFSSTQTSKLLSWNNRTRTFFYFIYIYVCVCVCMFAFGDDGYALKIL